MKLFLLLILFLNTGVAGLPPTTLKGQGQSSSTTTFNFQVPAKQATKTSTGTLIETGNANILSNSDFEHSTVSTDITTSGSGIALSAESTNVISGLQSLKMALTSSTNAQVILESTANSQWSGVQATASCKIKTSLSGIKFCSISGGVEDNCLDVSSANTWQDYLIPTVASSSSTNGLKVKVGSGTLTGDVYVDGCKYASGLNQLDVGQAQIAGVAYFAETGSCSWSRTSGTLGAFTSTAACPAPTVEQSYIGSWQTTDTDLPKITINNLPAGSYEVTVTGYMDKASGNDEAQLAISDGTNNRGTAETYLIAGGTANAFSMTGVFNYSDSGNRTFEVYGRANSGSVRMVYSYHRLIFTVKYFPPQSKIISASNQDYDWTAYTPSFNAFGTPTSVECFHKRQGSDLLLSCKFIAGATTGGTALVYFPNNLVASNSLPSVVTVGSASNYNTQTILTGSGANYVGFGNGVNGVSVSLSYRSASSFVNSGDPVSFYARIPIQGWNTPNQVIATVKDVLTTPNFPNGKPRFYSAFISSSGVVSREKGDFINGNCTNSSPMICTLNSGFTDLNCVGSPYNSTVAGRVTSYGNTVIDIQYSGNPQLDTTIFCHGY